MHISPSFPHRFHLRALFPIKVCGLCAVLLLGGPAAFCLAQSPDSAPGQSVVLPAGTILQVELMRNTPLHRSAALHARLLYPVFADGRIALPALTLVEGSVDTLRVDSATRRHALLYGDFTPYRVPGVNFLSLSVPSGSLALHANVSGGAPVLKLSRPGSTPRRGFVRKQFDAAKTLVVGTVKFFIAPGRKDRMVQVVYHQLPWHPQRIDKGTAWTLELSEPLRVPAEDLPAISPPATTNLVQATLKTGISSATAHAGDEVTAVVAEPFHNAAAGIDIPQGAELVGKVTEAAPARSRARNGKLRFTFQQIRMPASTQQVEGTLAGAASAKPQDLTLDAEGGIAPQDKSSIVMPVGLAILAQRAMDYDDPDLELQSAVASNGFGLMGRIVGTASGQRNLAAGIGFYAAALSLWENYLKHGRDAEFPRGTRIEVEMAPAHVPMIKPHAAN